jgi:para-nitrobenzyl esterase
MDKTGIGVTLLAATLGCSLPEPGPPARVEQAETLTTIVETAAGTLRGVASNGRLVFRDIPYAAPPVGELRFAPPQPPVPWSGIRDASTFGPRCPQAPTPGFPQNEDCLRVHVYAPEGATSGAALPVMVYLHGAGNRGSSPQTVELDSNTLPSRDVVFVTVQYRLGALGWVAYPQLPQAGSNGLLDQMAALRWVQDNIAQFGGDPTRVTLFGQSAGARDVLAQLAAPAAKGLFSRAIIESGAIYANSLATALALGATVETNAGCAGAADVVACLRSKTAAALVAAMPPTGPSYLFGYALAPIVDGAVLSENPIDTLRRDGAAVPVILGSLTDEWYFFNPPAMTPESYAAAVTATVGAERAQVFLSLYPASLYASPLAAYVDWVSDYAIQCPMRYLARVLHGDDRPPVWKYVFANRLDNNATLSALGAYHTQEVSFVTGYLASFRGIAYTPTEGEVALSAAMQGDWTRFAASGDPNPPHGIEWHRYSPGREWYRRFDETIASGARWHSELCDVWDEAPDLWAK